ncbi:MAG: DUF3616 domain-containing protein [Pseudomonadota bacterium]
MPDHRIDTVTLRFRDASTFAHVVDPFAEDLSAAARAEDTLFLSCDETAGIDRLRADAPGLWGQHEHLSLGSHFDLPDGPEGEMDIEGLAAEDGWLWIVGSHALKRRRPKREEKDAARSLGRMRRMTRDPNRYFLGRMPLAPAEHGGLMPVGAHRGRRAASLRLRPNRAALTDWLAKDPLLAPFLAIPSKENGLDIEGLAARGDTVWLGLRGPVLRGHAVILRLALRQRGKLLRARKIEEDRRYALHLVPSAGLGIRDLARDGDDLILLTGPVLGSDGPSHILRWCGGARSKLPSGEGVVASDEVEELLELPYLGPRDHPEGITRWPEAGDDAWLVVCDSPAEARLDPARLSVKADIVALPPRR